MITVSISKQRLYHRRKTGVCYSYPVSTAANGAGSEAGSFKTPLGRHRIAEKIGNGLPLYTAFKAREPFCIYHPEQDKDGAEQEWILTRILWLAGCETGRNRRGRVDSRSRYIYIHGTDDEDSIGRALSHGCIRMNNLDMLELFEHVKSDERVYIKP